MHLCFLDSHHLPHPPEDTLQQWHFWANRFEFEGNPKISRAFPHFPSDFPFFQVSILGLSVDSERLSDLMHSRASRFPLIYTSNCVLSLSVKLRTERMPALTWIWIDLYHITGVDEVEAVSKLHFLCAHPSYSSDESELQIRVIYGRSRRKGIALVGARLLARQQPPQLSER